MDDLLSETVPAEDLKKFEKIYNEQLYKNEVTPKAQFEYAWCLVRSKYAADIRKGLLLLQELYSTHEEGQRDYLYYLAFGNAKIKEYTKALGFVRSFLSIEPTNAQVIALESTIKKKMDKEGLLGIAMASGVIFAVGALVGLGMHLSNKK